MRTLLKIYQIILPTAIQLPCWNIFTRGNFSVVVSTGSIWEMRIVVASSNAIVYYFSVHYFLDRVDMVYYTVRDFPYFHVREFWCEKRKMCHAPYQSLGSAACLFLCYDEELTSC
jgi:hypothetical protein